MNLSLEEWGNVAQCVAVVAGLVGLLYAAGQFREMKRSTETAAYLAFEETVLDVGRLFIEHPRLRPYFYGSRAAEACDDEDLRIRIESATIYLTDFFDHALTVRRMLPDTAEWSHEMWQAWIEDMHKTSPALFEFREKNKAWHIEKLRAIEAARPTLWQRIKRNFALGRIPAT